MSTMRMCIKWTYNFTTSPTCHHCGYFFKTVIKMSSSSTQTPSQTADIALLRLLDRILVLNYVHCAPPHQDMGLENFVITTKPQVVEALKNPGAANLLGTDWCKAAGARNKKIIDCYEVCFIVYRRVFTAVTLPDGPKSWEPQTRCPVCNDCPLKIFVPFVVIALDKI